MQGRNGKPECAVERSLGRHTSTARTISEQLSRRTYRERPRIAVAIPVRDEAERIAACLTALNGQDRLPDMVLLLLNNCTDATEAIARVLAPSLRFELELVCRELPPAQANAGSARRIAMALAARAVGPDGILLTTDATQSFRLTGCDVTWRVCARGRT